MKRNQTIRREACTPWLFKGHVGWELKRLGDGSYWRESLEETCKSPLNHSCGGRDIAVYIVWDGKRLPICHRCWEQIAETDLEWGEGVSKAKLKRQVEEAQKAIIEKAMEEAVEKEAAKFARSLKSRGGGRAKRKPSGLKRRDSG